MLARDTGGRGVQSAGGCGIAQQAVEATRETVLPVCEVDAQHGSSATGPARRRPGPGLVMTIGVYCRLPWRRS